MRRGRAAHMLFFVSKTSDPSRAVLKAALRLAEATPWARVSLRAVAEEAGVPLKALYGVARTKDDLIAALADRFDAGAAERAAIDPAAPIRERLFAAAMARFDALESRRAGYAPIVADTLDHPLRAARAWPRLVRTARWLIEVAGTDASGPAGLARAHAFAAVLAETTRAWLADDAGGLARTQATLDRALARWERWGGPTWPSA